MTDQRFDSEIAASNAAADAPLSAVGMARRDRMLAELTDGMHRLHRARRTRRRAAAIVVPAMLLTIGVLLWRDSSPTNPQPGSGPLALDHKPQGNEIPAAPEPKSPVMIVTRVRSGDLPVDQFRVRTAASPASAEILSDNELLTALAAIDRPTGLVRAGERTWLTRSVADL